LTIMQRSILGAFGMVFLLVQVAQGADRTFFVGNWYGVGEPDDPSISYIDSYQADGTFHSEFRKCERGEVVWHQTETGKWSLSNGVLRMISDTIDGKPDRFDNSYTVELASGDEFRARLHDQGFLFIERRLAKFEFPPCYVGA
ncbi:MAG: hypothetical protein QOF03_1081, partial [Alphaproteobacteria bacterium]|nr:hypothetical protein [Alphaproteobacteria bacterium]